jgi:hypothetical protein
MFNTTTKYLIGLKYLVAYISSNATHHIFKGDNTEFYISKSNQLSVRQAFKYIKL